VLDSTQLQDEVVRVGPWSAGGDRLLMANFPNEEGAEIQLFQPLDGPSARLLDRRGEGVHHVCFTPPDVDGAAEELRQTPTAAMRTTTACAAGRSISMSSITRGDQTDRIAVAFMEH